MKDKETENNQLRDNLSEIQESVESLKRKSMTKEELEADERKHLNKQLTDSKEVIETLRSELKNREVSIKRQAIALKEGVPHDLMDMVTGEDEDEIRLKCRKLADYAKRAASPSEILTNTVTETGSEKNSSGEETNKGSANQGQQSGKESPKTFADIRNKLKASNADIGELFGVGRKR